MTNTNTTTKTGYYYRALMALVAMLGAMLVASGAALAATTTFGSGSFIGIPDQGPASLYPSQINVQNVTGKISDLDVRLDAFRHTFPDDVDVLLVGPHGQKILLMSDVGGAVDVPSVFGPDDQANLVFDDEATTSLPDEAQITSGTYKPTQGTSAGGSSNPVPANFPAPAPAGPYATSLSAFDNTDPNGTWNLYVIDDSAQDHGAIGFGWRLELTTDTTAPKVTSTTPAAGATGVSPTANVKATFSEDMDHSTINGTSLQLFKKGSTTKLTATVTYQTVISTDATAYRAILDPANSLQRGATYKAVVTTDARDLAGNRLDQNSTLAGLQQKAWTFTVQN